ncbi:hypothetical protein [Mycobacteroides abscessus]|uniref:hypothetical protein n=1 Tax=Mycobacteroides abscessus TaxID=36809 RepID=UPI0005EA52B6|nr:hypothetical protein [Mycobacteroides abscessus]MBE5511023.1 hypothetical protein [Mycobacteroides abscessus]MBN7388982.1 hypothetical protein [Mycobacteroides abscessus subsp. abscessus]MBN7418563.1 hypothetical protein [Mycobacteroides abscessus subsp. abscessus]MBN7486468.1 hypothetical protein [Mycobacteroides abscessus subsp. abscessus]MBN7501498.1 hypothetical protein [Mycobacteroides abscessus subsp. abscessus]
MGMCGQWRRLRALALIGVSVLAGCDFTGAQSADRIDQSLKPLPGVSSVSHTVGRNGGFGPTEVSFDVYVRDEATTDQLSALTHVFTDQIHASRAFRTLRASLHVRRWPPGNHMHSTMYVELRPSVTTPEPPWQDWLRLSRGDYGYEITGWATPADHDRSAGTSLEITLFDGKNRRPGNIGAEEFAAVVRRLAADFPQSRSDWVITNSFIYANDPPSIRSAHGLPTPAQLRLWQALDAIAPVHGAFNLDPLAFNPKQPDSNRIRLGKLAPRDMDRVAVKQLQLIAKSETATVYDIDEAQITVRPGRCSAGVQEPQPRTPDNVNMQAKLRAQFETCPR